MGKLIPAGAALAATAALVVIVATILGSKTQEIKIGIIMGFTGPPESVTPAMADASGDGDQGSE